MEGLIGEILRYVQVVLGISLVIFVHELGHFLAARWCGVRVEVFSLGMGPRILGWRRGATLYQVALVPIGGYVRMGGEDALDPRKPRAADDLLAKSVGQRFLIYSGGVIANVVFGLVAFPVVFAVGVPCTEPLLGSSVPGSPAWHAGLAQGTRVVSVNGKQVFDFGHIVTEVALGSPEQVELSVLEPGAASPRSVRLVPEYSKEIGAYKIGVAPSADPRGRLRVGRGTPAEQAGLRDGDRILSVEGALPGLAVEDQLYLATRDGRPFSAHFERDGRPFTAEIRPSAPEEEGDRVLGLAPVLAHVLALRDTPLAAASGLRRDDRLVSVAGVAVRREFDFLRALLDAPEGASMVVERDGLSRTLPLPELSRDERLALDRDVALGPDRGGTRVTVKAGSAADAAGLRDGDRVLAIDGREMRRYDDVYEALRAARDGRPLSIRVERAGAGGSPQFLDFTASVGALPRVEYGLTLQSAQYIYRTRGPVESLRAGLGASWKFLEESWLTLKRILFGQVSGQNIGGIITIGVVSHSWAALGWTKLLFFLCMLSMNLAFINVLPIPVFDGGHLLFLVIEKVKGSPVSERVLSYSQMVGVVIIVSLLIYVTYNDVMRLLPG